MTFNGTFWTAPTEKDPGHALESVSCAPGTTFCAAVDAAGNALTSNAGVWSAAVSIDSGQALRSVSCPTAPFCIAVDAAGNAMTYNTGVWGTPLGVDPGHSLSSVSCPTVSFCAAVDTAGNALTDPPSQAELEVEAAARKAEEEAAARKRAEEAAAKAASEQHKAGTATGGAGAKGTAATNPKLGRCVSSAQKAFKRDKQRALRLHGKARANGLHAAQKKKQQSLATCKRRFG
jgi:hypothetical protein